MTHLRQLMLDELERRNYSPNTVRSYLHAVEEFARHFGRSPEQLGPDHVREYQVQMFRDRKLSARTIAGQTAALRRPYLPDALPFPKRLIDASCNLMHRAMVMTLYATGVRRAELCRIKVADIDNERMVLHIHEGKGGLGVPSENGPDHTFVLSGRRNLGAHLLPIPIMSMPTENATLGQSNCVIRAFEAAIIPMRDA